MTTSPCSPSTGGVVDVVQQVTIACKPHEFLDFVMDIDGYAAVDDKIAPILWSRREGDVVTFACRPKLAGLHQPKVVQTMRLTPGERIDITLAPLPHNRLAHRMAQFEASFACRAVAGGTEITRTLRFHVAAILRWALVPLLSRRVPSEVAAELDRARHHFASDLHPGKS